jgi:NAD(P) transhydrogenase subunit alpha
MTPAMAELSVGIPTEAEPETRVAMVPLALPALTGAGLRVVVAKGAGTAAGYPDSHYEEKGAALGSEDEAWRCDVVLRIRALGGGSGKLGAGQSLIGVCGALLAPPALADVARQGATVFALELIPRIARAQSMDVLSSQATVAGYRAVLLAAAALPKLFPMLTTAAGTVAPARVLVVGAGVAGLQAIATARRLGALVDAYDVRPAVKEQVQSLGARFVELPIETAGADGGGDYAQAQDEAFYRHQQELMARVVAASDVVVTTAAVPGQAAPKLLTAAMVEGMQPGSVVVDVVADQGGNCELTRPGETVVHQGVTVIGHDNLPATAPFHASQFYARNISSFLVHLVKDGALHIDLDDEITRETLVARGGEIVNPRVRQAFGLPLAAEASS